MTGTITISTVESSGLSFITFTWTADGSGDVNGHTISSLADKRSARLMQVRISSEDSPQPDDQYDLTVVDDHGIDLLNGQGADLDQSGNYVVFDPPLYVMGAILEPRITNAGSGGSGMLTFVVQA